MFRFREKGGCYGFLLLVGRHTKNRLMVDMKEFMDDYHFFFFSLDKLKRLKTKNLLRKIEEPTELHEEEKKLRRMDIKMVYCRFLSRIKCKKKRYTKKKKTNGLVAT